MSRIVHRRDLMAAARELAKTNAPTEAHYAAVANALAQVFTDDTEIDCQCVIKISLSKEEQAKLALGEKG